MAWVDDDISAAAVVEATIVTANLPCLAEHPVLVAPLTVTRPHVDRLVVAVVVSRTVNAHRLGLAADLDKHSQCGNQ